MKKIVLFLVILISLNAFSQTNPKPKEAPKDSITNQTVFYITVDDISRYADKFKDVLTHRQWEGFALALQGIINDMIAEKKNVKPKGF
jgi:hypothetical protein